MLQNVLFQLLHHNQGVLIYKNQSFSTLNLVNRSIEIINILTTMQCSSSQHIAFCLPNSPELLCWQLACFHLGIPIIPIIYEQDSSHINQVITLVNAHYLITTTEKHALIKQSLPPQCKIKLVDDTYEKINTTNQQNIQLTPSTIDPNNLAMIIFSSGTSGVLKGITHSYRSFYGFMQTLIEILIIKHGLTYLIAQPMGHIGGISTTLITLLYNGTAVLLPGFDTHNYMQAMQEYQPTHINLHTPLYYDLLNYPNINKKAFNNVICAFAGGDNIPENLATAFTKKTGAPLRIGYGMTEIGIVIINPNPYDQHKGSIGKKIKSVQIQLRDNNNNPVAQGEPGEIWVQSPACCSGYWNLPELNQKTFIDGWFKTGDLAYLDQENYYWYMSRASEIIHHKNHIIYPSIIEQILFAHPAIKAAAVIGLPDENKKEIPIAFIELKNKSTNPVTPDQIMKYATEHLQEWQIPNKIIILDKLPLNLTGKIDGIKLKKLYAKDRL